MKSKRLVFWQRHSSRTSYDARTAWLQYWINLFTRVPVNFQKKTNIAFNDWLDLRIVLVSVLAPGIVNDASSVLFLIFCAGNIFDNGNPIVSNKYKN